MSKIRPRTLAAIFDQDYDRLPRRIKKHVFGKRMRKSTLQRLLDSVELGMPIKTMYERRESNTGLFCPHCGYRDYRGGGNRAEYPEHWEYFRCLRCGSVVGYIDNSPFIHALECKEWDYNPVF
jgi:transcription initiation factor IIE alpha subunit